MKVKRSHKQVKFKQTIRFKDIDRDDPVVRSYFDVYTIIPKYVTINDVKFVLAPSFGAPCYFSEDYLQSSSLKKKKDYEVRGVRFVEG